jgi:hypothetical protein
MITCHTVVLPAATSSVTHCPPSCRCHYSRGWLNLWLCYNMYLKSFIHQSAMLPRKTSVQKRKQKVLLWFCIVFFVRIVLIADTLHSTYNAREVWVYCLAVGKTGYKWKTTYAKGLLYLFAYHLIWNKMSFFLGYAITRKSFWYSMGLCYNLYYNCGYN